MSRKVLLASALLIGACGDDDISVASEDARTSTTEATASKTVPPTGRAGPPAILVASGSEILRVDGGDVDVVGKVDGEATLAYGDGISDIQAVEVGGTLVAMLDGSPMQLDPGAPGKVFLFDLENIDGVPHALYGVFDAKPDAEHEGRLLLGSITGEERRDLGAAYAVEFTTFAGSIGGGLVSVSAYTDLTESVDIFPLDGSGPSNPWTPTRDLAYNEPPLVLDAILAPDGDTIAWLSGPDSSGSQSVSDQTVGSWEVVVADLDGVESHRIALDDEPRATRLDYDGARLLVSREGTAALLIDLADGSQRELPVAGTATFDG